MDEVQTDKIGHFIVGALIVLLWTVVAGPSWALMATALTAWGKERYDKAHPAVHTWDGWDAFATLLGGVVMQWSVAVLVPIVQGLV